MASNGGDVPSTPSRPWGGQGATPLITGATPSVRHAGPHGVHFSSVHLDWRTPRGLFNELHEEFRFTIDVCASDENALLDRYWTERDEALLRPWAGERVWMNPPYGRQLPRFMEKAWNESPDAACIVALVPSRTDTAWWHDYAMEAREIRFIRGRLEFAGHTKTNPTSHNAPFPSCVVVW